MFDQHLLTTIVVLPLVGAAFCLCFPPDPTSGVRAVALLVTIANLALGAVAWSRFVPEQAGLQLAEFSPWVSHLGIGWRLGVDGLSLCLLELALVLAPSAVLALMGGSGERAREQVACLLALQGTMIGAIVAADLFVFYVFFEAMLLPAAFWVLGSGGVRRQLAAGRFLLFTLVGSLPMLVALLGTVRAAANLGPITFALEEVSARLAQLDLASAEPWLLLGFVLAFAIKAALFPSHGWLPGLYEQAPPAATVLVAGVMGKIGALCLVRYGLLLFPLPAARLLPVLATLAVAGVIWAGCLAVAQTTVRGLLAYASVSHMGLMALGLFAMTPLSVAGAMVQMVNHGLCLGGLFVLVGVLAERRGLQALAEGGGLAHSMPRLATMFVALSLGFLGLPGLGGFLGELMVFVGAFAGQGVTASVSVAALARLGIALLGCLGLLVVGALGLALLRSRPPVGRLGQGLTLALVSAAASMLVAPPVAATRGGLLVRPLAAWVDHRGPATEVLAIVSVVALATTVLGAIYMLYAVQRLFFGPQRPANAGLVDLSARELAAVVPLLLLSLWLGLMPQPVLRRLEPAAGALVRQFRSGASMPAVLER